MRSLRPFSVVYNAQGMARLETEVRAVKPWYRFAVGKMCLCGSKLDSVGLHWYCWFMDNKQGSDVREDSTGTVPVISPLLLLMIDQVTSLREQGTYV